ncbi:MULTISPECIES: protein phosphatase CheZ [unclassified Azospirillum]|uniref:protein phosphatase CheZ n=1 Tax=unclassified Azospirillum TaxID=2630922 RepID=UPI000B63C18B|nr:MULTISPECIES: protein phosphatase CheZ [unclassified Azospirillum]SNR95169.1 Chemotaxis regulator CheZ, phosphatase of CheY~P [Azospirillum sp. RU38E]SNS11482.1 Chemotaxis regulator CheZ, phosphatase of CheY~P [Azospirillum sp. RU37A]
MSEIIDLSDAEFDQIEDALLSSPRGRAFLRVRDRRHRAVSLDDLRRIVRERRDPPEVDQRSHIKILRRELQELSSHIAETRREIAALKPDDPSANRIMRATEELDAILQSTEHATTEILNGSERIQSVADRLRKDHPDLAQILDAEVTEIMTACSFQDITGQRMTKVVNTLRYIERRVHAMIQIWGLEGVEEGELSAVLTEDKDTRPDADLMHGPPLRDAINQDAVDMLLAGAASALKQVNDPLAAKPAVAAASSPAPVARPPVSAMAEEDAVAGDATPMSQSAVDDLFP